MWLPAGRWFSPGTWISSTNKTDNYDITEILLKVALNTITLSLTFSVGHLEMYYIDNNNFNLEAIKIQKILVSVVEIRVIAIF